MQYPDGLGTILAASTLKLTSLFLYWKSNWSDIQNMEANRRLLLVVLLTLYPAILFGYSELPPLSAANASKARDMVVAAAYGYIGAPYLYGGETAKGMDCSGLVFAVFSRALNSGVITTGGSVAGSSSSRIPRTVSQQAQWALKIPRSQLKPGDLLFFVLEPAAALTSAKPDHVAIYVGESRFIHAASTGSPKGVTINSLNESRWSSRFLFAGRVFPPSKAPSIAFEWGAEAMFDASPEPFKELRGASVWSGIELPLGKNFSIGLRAQIKYDSRLSILRFPIEATLGQTSGFSLFAGAAGTLDLNSGEIFMPGETASNLVLAPNPLSTETRFYYIPAGLLSTIGIRWSPLLFTNSSSYRAGPFLELRYNHLLAEKNQPWNSRADQYASFTISAGFRVRTIH